MISHGLLFCNEQVSDDITLHCRKCFSYCAEEMDISLDKQSWFGVLSRSMAVHELLFCDVEGSCDMDWHTAPCRQFVIIIDGQFAFRSTT